MAFPQRFDASNFYWCLFEVISENSDEELSRSAPLTVLPIGGFAVGRATETGSTTELQMAFLQQKRRPRPHSSPNWKGWAGSAFTVYWAPRVCCCICLWFIDGVLISAVKHKYTHKLSAPTE